MIVAEDPPVTPVTRPVVLPTLALPGLLLLQVPPVVASVSWVVKPLHTAVLPVIASGSALTVTTTDDAQPPAVA